MVGYSPLPLSYSDFFVSSYFIRLALKEYSYISLMLGSGLLAV